MVGVADDVGGGVWGGVCVEVGRCIKNKIGKCYCWVF